MTKEEYELLKAFACLGDNELLQLDMLKDLQLKGKYHIYMLFIGINSNQKSYEKFIEENKDIYNHYNEILKKCSNLSKGLNLKNSLEISILFTYLLWNGFYSNTKSNAYQKGKRYNVEGLESLDIMRGIGVCMNHSTMLRDLLITNGYPSSNVANFLQTMDRGYKPEIKRTINESSFESKVISKILLPIAKRSGNHAFTLIYDNGLYIYDSTNVATFCLSDIYSAHYMQGEGTSVLKPFFSYFANPTSKHNKALDKLHTSSVLTSPYTGEDFISSFESCTHLFNRNIKLLNDYYDETKDDITFVAERLETTKVKML